MKSRPKMRKLKQTGQFKRDLKRELRSHTDLSNLTPILRCLEMEVPLALQFHDHELSGNYKGYREYHVCSDMLLIYKIADSTKIDLVTLTRLGSHALLFGK